MHFYNGSVTRTVICPTKYIVYKAGLFGFFSKHQISIYKVLFTPERVAVQRGVHKIQHIEHITFNSKTVVDGVFV